MIKAHKERIIKIKEEMNSLAVNKQWDLESSHYEADALLCELLTILGYSDIVNDFEKLDKWYA